MRRGPNPTRFERPPLTRGFLMRQPPYWPEVRDVPLPLAPDPGSFLPCCLLAACLLAALAAPGCGHQQEAPPRASRSPRPCG